MSGNNRGNEVRSWQESMRAALYDGVTEGDMAEIVKGLVSSAKKGDLKATDMLFKWTMGQPQTTVQQVVVMNNDDGRGSPIDAVARRVDDPSPAEIAERRLKIRDERENQKRKA
jgi:hypothetical protein